MTTTTAQATSGAPPSKTLHIALWVVQALLAFAFGSAGLMKMTQPIPVLVEKMVWPGALPEAVVRFIGASEFVGALGLILPALFHVKPKLTPLAAVGLTTIMILAALFHLSRGEFGALPTNIVLGGLAAFVAWGRLKKAPISAPWPDEPYDRAGAASQTPATGSTSFPSKNAAGRYASPFFTKRAPLGV